MAVMVKVRVSVRVRVGLGGRGAVGLEVGTLTAHQSQPKLTPSPRSISGATYSGVPHLVGN